MSRSLPSLDTGTKGWFILRFEDPSERAPRDILVVSDSAEPIQSAIGVLETTLLERFNRMSVSYATCKFRIHLTVTGPDAKPVHITIQQLFMHLRDIPPSLSPVKPDLWGWGKNVVSVMFERA